MPPPSPSPPTPNKTFRSHPLHHHTLRQPPTTAQVGPIAVVSISRANEVDCEAEFDRAVKIETSAALPTPPLPPSFQHYIIHVISPPLSKLGGRGGHVHFSVRVCSREKSPPGWVGEWANEVERNDRETTTGNDDGSNGGEKMYGGGGGKGEPPATFMLLPPPPDPTCVTPMCPPPCTVFGPGVFQRKKSPWVGG